MKSRWMLALFTLILATAVAGCFNLSPGEGEKIGQVVRINKEGLFCKTREGQLIRGGLSDGSGAFGITPFYFTIESEEMARKVEEYMRKQTEVIIKYRMEGFWGPCRSNSSGHFLVSIEPSPTNKK